MVMFLLLLLLLLSVGLLGVVVLLAGFVISVEFVL